MGLIQRFLPKKLQPPPRKGFGMVETMPEPDDFKLGSAQAQKYLLSPERDFTNFLPVREMQNRGFETWSCVSFSALNNLEILHKKLFGKEINASDRYIASLSGTVPEVGNSFKTVGDTIRKNGLVLEEEYPWGGNNVHEYLVKPSDTLVLRGKEFLRSFDIQYEWIGFGGCKPDDLYTALQFGPLQASIDANAAYSGVRSTAVNHAITIYKAVKNKSFSIWDHYDRAQYDLPWWFFFGSAFQFSLLKKKMLPLVQVYGRPEIYAVVGSLEACHIADEKTWEYGQIIGLWEKAPQVILKETFNKTYTLGKALTFA